MRTVITISLGVLISLFASHAVAQSVVYKWVDERGVSQYTQTPPTGRNYETVRMGTGGQRSTEPEAEAESTAEPGAANPVSTAADQERQEYCDAARRNLETLESDQAVMLEAEEGGEPAMLDDAQRAEQMQVAQRQVTLFCRD